METIEFLKVRYRSAGLSRHLGDIKNIQVLSGRKILEKCQTDRNSKSTESKKIHAIDFRFFFKSIFLISVQKWYFQLLTNVSTRCSATFLLDCHKLNTFATI